MLKALGRRALLWVCLTVVLEKTDLRTSVGSHVNWIFWIIYNVHQFLNTLFFVKSSASLCLCEHRYIYIYTPPHPHFFSHDVIRIQLVCLSSEIYNDLPCFVLLVFSHSASGVCLYCTSCHRVIHQLPVFTFLSIVVHQNCIVSSMSRFYIYFFLFVLFSSVLYHCCFIIWTF